MLHIAAVIKYKLCLSGWVCCTIKWSSKKMICIVTADSMVCVCACSLGQAERSTRIHAHTVCINCRPLLLTGWMTAWLLHAVSSLLNSITRKEEKAQMRSNREKRTGWKSKGCLWSRVMFENDGGILEDAIYESKKTNERVSFKRESRQC